MTKLLNTDSWKQKPRDIAYKDPFSESTSRTRKKVILFSSIILLNHFFPLDLGKSHILGLHFLPGHAPSLAGLLSLLLIYFTVILAVYSYQEIKSWLAQANEIALVNYQRSLHDIYAHFQTIHQEIENTAKQLETHTNSVNEFKEEIKRTKEIDQNIIEKHMSSMNVNKESFKNIYTLLGNSNTKFGNEIDKAINLLNSTAADYKKAMSTQWVKVAFLELALPFAMSVFSILLAYSGMLQVIEILFK